MASAAPRAKQVAEVTPGVLDFAGNQISCLYAYHPPDYAVYRTKARVMIHFADCEAVAKAQRDRIACLTPLRGQISSLIDGWHTAENPWWRPRLEENPIRKKANRYDRRTADAIVLGLDNSGNNAAETAQVLLAEIKNDIISERTSMARTDYLRFALFLVGLLIFLAWVASWPEVQHFFLFPNQMPAVWTSVSGGAVGAFFSIAIGLKNRAVLIDLQNRDNRADALLRMLIGVIAGGMILCLLLSGLISKQVGAGQLNPGERGYEPLLVFMIGFLAGFFERLVPDLLSQTNLGTKEKSGTQGGTAAATPPSTPPTPTPPTPTTPAAPDGPGPETAAPAGSAGAETPTEDGAPPLADEPPQAPEADAPPPDSSEDGGGTDVRP